MKITIYGHACFTVENNDRLVIIDPGIFTDLAGVPDKIDAVIITHLHPDHFDPSQLSTIRQKNNGLTLYAPKSVVETLGTDFNAVAVTGGQTITNESFSFDFIDAPHEDIHESIKLPENIGVVINKKVYYPGDSFTLPNVPIEVLALPVSAPWLKLSEALEFMTQVLPTRAFPTHNALLSEIGMTMVDTMVKNVADTANVIYLPSTVHYFDV